MLVFFRVQAPEITMKLAFSGNPWHAWTTHTTPFLHYVVPENMLPTCCVCILGYAPCKMVQNYKFLITILSFSLLVAPTQADKGFLWDEDYNSTVRSIHYLQVGSQFLFHSAYLASFHT